MSDGPSDANAVGKLDDDVRSATYRLKEALKSAKRGHRGLVPGGLLETINVRLKFIGLKVIITNESIWDNL